MLISPWTITEFSSALALKEFVRSITHQERRAALTMFEKFRSLRLEPVPMEAANFEADARLCDASAAPLRAGDALHLAVCRRVRGSLATMDQGLAAAGQMHHHFQTGLGDQTGAVDKRSLTGVPAPLMQGGAAQAGQQDLSLRGVQVKRRGGAARTPASNHHMLTL
jgi:predicted nucleic acid-binding protein